MGCSNGEKSGFWYSPLDRINKEKGNLILCRCVWGGIVGFTKGVWVWMAL